MALSFIRQELLPSKVLHSCDLDLDSVTFIYELDPYSLDVYRICKYELPIGLRQGFRKLSSDGQTDRQTDMTEIIYHAVSRMVSNVIHV